LARVSTASLMQTPNYFWNYVPLLLQILAAVGLSSIIVVASWLIGRHRPGKVKLSTYECGIEPQGDARGRFSVRFYMVAMLFMFPWAVIYRKLPAITGSPFFGFWEMLVYIGFLLVGYFYIWKKGILEWSKDKADL
jgi:NADH-quinone oxidoreductase subunit A